MKKILLCITATILLFANLVSCNPNQQDSNAYLPYESYVHSISNNIQNKGIRTEAKYWRGEEFDDAPIIKRKTLTWDGVEYIGTYSHSEISAFMEFQTDYYTTEDKIEFGVSYETKKIVSVDFTSSEKRHAWCEATPVEDPDSVAIEKATEYLQTYSRDPSDYELTIDTPTATQANKEGKAYSIYAVQFTKKSTNECSLPDYVQVRVTSGGNLISVKIGSIGKYDDMQAFNKTRVYESIDQKLRETYSNVGYNVASYTFNRRMICKTPDHSYCLSSDISVVLEKNGETYTTLISLITILE